MTLTTTEKENLDLKFSAIQKSMESEFSVVNERLGQILDQTTKHNQRMTKIEKAAIIEAEKIIALEKKDLTHEQNCPFSDRVRELEDGRLTAKGMKTLIAWTVGIASGVSGCIWVLFNVFGG